MICKKCKGLMIEERQPELPPGMVAHRCLNCGLFLDPLIQKNRETPERDSHSLVMRSKGGSPVAVVIG
jgi:hypothetical protein